MCGGARHFVAARPRRNQLESVVAVTRASNVFNMAAVEQEARGTMGTNRRVGPTKNSLVLGRKTSLHAAGLNKCQVKMKARVETKRSMYISRRLALSFVFRLHLLYSGFFIVKSRMSWFCFIFVSFAFFLRWSVGMLSFPASTTPSSSSTMSTFEFLRCKNETRQFYCFQKTKRNCN